MALRITFAILFLASALFAQNPIGPQPVDTTTIAMHMLYPPVPPIDASVSQTGSPGRSTIYYWLVSHFTAGNSTVGGPYVGYSGNGILSGTNFFTVNWQTVPSALSYDLLKTNSPTPPTGACNCAVATGIIGSSQADQSNSTGAYTVTTFDPNSALLQLDAEAISAGAAGVHMLLKQNNVLVCDLSTGCGSGGTTIIGSPAVGVQVAANGTNFLAQVKPVYDVRDWMTCDGTTDASAGMATLLSSIGSNPATILVKGQCLLGNTTFPAKVALDFTGGGSLKAVTSATPPGGAGFVQSAGTVNASTPTNSCSVTLSGTHAGNSIVFMTQIYIGDSINRTMSTVSDGVNTYVNFLNSGNSQASVDYAWYASNIAGGTITIAAPISTPSTPNVNMCMAHEYSGLGTTPTFTGGTATSVGGTVLSAGPTSISAGSLLVGFGGQPYFNESCTAGAGYIQPAGSGGSVGGQTQSGGFQNGWGESLCSEYQLSSAGGATSISQTVSGSMNPSGTATGRWLYSLIAAAPGSSTLTILGGILDPDLHQIFYNTLGGQGKVDFTGATVLDRIYPEYWGASPQASASVNTPALQAAEIGAFGNNRTNGTGLSAYNRELHLSGMYQINDELQWYHVNSFLVTGTGRVRSGITQTATNKRIIDSQSLAYGTFADFSFGATASQDASHPLFDLDYDGSQGNDLRPQFVTFQNVGFQGSGLAAIGLLIAKSGGGAQGSNIDCSICAGAGFTQAVEQIGLPLSLAQNALANSWVGGDIQNSPQYGIVVYGGQISVGGTPLTTFENGILNQTGFDVACFSPQQPCYMTNVRSESAKLMAGNFSTIKNSYTIFQATEWDSGPGLAGTAASVGQLVSGSSGNGDGNYFSVTGAGTWGGLNTTAATSGSATTITCSGCTWTTNAFAGSRILIASGAGTGASALVTSNTATTITVPNWNTVRFPLQYSFLKSPPPDNTSTFMVEPNWGTQTTSGTVTFAAFPFNVIDDGLGGLAHNVVLENVILAAGQINATGTFNTVGVTRPDWMGNNSALQTDIVTSQYNNVLVRLPCGGCQWKDGDLLTWSFPKNGSGGAAYSGYSQDNMGSLPMVWSAGQVGGGLAAGDVWIGGRSDPNSGASVSRAVLEYGGILGPPTQFGPNGSGNAAGLPTRIQQGLSSGNQLPGPYEIWCGTAGISGAQPNPGSACAGVRENGLSWTLKGAAVASAASITPTGNLFHLTGTTGITSISGTGVSAGTEITIIFDGVLTVTNGSNLVLAGNFTTAANSTLTLAWDGANWYEKSRKA